MVSKLKKKNYHFTFQTFIRVLIFAGLVYFLISYFSSKKTSESTFYDPTVLGEETEKPSSPLNIDKTINSLYNSIPEENRQKIENINNNPVVVSIQEKINYIKSQTQDFPQKYIKEAKKALLKNVYENVLKSIDTQ